MYPSPNLTAAQTTETMELSAVDEASVLEVSGLVRRDPYQQSNPHDQPLQTDTRMSLAFLVRQHCANSQAQRDAWEKTIVELHVILAYCDGILSQDERMTLSLRSVGNPENAAPIMKLARSIEQYGLAQAAGRVVKDLRELFEGVPAGARRKIALQILRESISATMTDGTISEEESAFMRDKLAPALGIEPQITKDLLTCASGQLNRERAYAERGLELFVMLSDLSDSPPTLSVRDTEVLPGFLGAVDAFVEHNKVASSQAVAYFLAVFGGVFWVDEYELHLLMMRDLVKASREIRKPCGTDGRLQAMQHELGQVRNRGVDPEAFRSVARHLMNAVERMGAFNESQVELLVDKIVPILELDSDIVLQTVRQQDPAHDTVNDSVVAEKPGDGVDDRKSIWWRFW